MPFLENATSWFSKTDKKMWLALLMVFLLGFGLRYHMTKYALPFEFDSYWHARMLGILVQEGSVPLADPMAYYQAAGIPGGRGVDLSAPLFWNISAAIYNALNGFGSYDKQAIVETMFLVPALFGALAAVAVFFLVREVLNAEAGYVAATMAAVMPAFVYRTMAGFFEPTSMGYFWIVLGFYFLARSVNRLENFKSALLNAAASGILLGLLALSWKGYQFVLLILIPFFLFSLWGVWSKEKKSGLLPKMLACFAIVFVSFIAIASITSGWGWLAPLFLDTPLSYIQRAFPTATLPLLLGLLFGAGILIAAAVYFFRPQESQSAQQAVSWARTGLLLLLALSFIAIILLNIDLSNRTGTLGTSVGEENIGNQFFGNKYNALWLLSLAALVLIPIRERSVEKDRSTTLLFFLVLVTIVMAYIKLKFTFLHGLPLAVAIGVVGYYAMDFVKRVTPLEKKLVSVFFGLLLLVGIAAGSYFMAQQYPTIEEGTGWKEALAWLKDNTPKESKMFNWWDEGHWISFLGERAVLIDNRNIDLEADADVARFLITSDGNEAIEIVQSYGSTHAILGDDLLTKQSSLGVYAYYIHGAINYNDPRLQGYFGFSASCGKSEAPLTREVNYSCGGTTLSESQMQSIPTQWQSAPNQLMPDGRTAIFLYRSKESDRLYALNAKSNETAFAKIWFREPTMAQYFPELYSVKGVKVFAINWKP